MPLKISHFSSTEWYLTVLARKVKMRVWCLWRMNVQWVWRINVRRMLTFQITYWWMLRSEARTPTVLAKTKFRRQAQVKSQVSVIIHWSCATPTTSPESNATTNPSPWEGGTRSKSGKAVVIMEGPSHHYGVGCPPHQINTRACGHANNTPNGKFNLAPANGSPISRKLENILQRSSSVHRILYPLHWRSQKW